MPIPLKDVRGANARRGHNVRFVLVAGKRGADADVTVHLAEDMYGIPGGNRHVADDVGAIGRNPYHAAGVNIDERVHCCLERR